MAEIRQSTATRGPVLHDLLVMASDPVMASAKRPPDDLPNFGVSPQKASDVVVAWPVTVRVHTTGDYVQLVELKFKLRRGRRRRGYSISDEFLRGLNLLGL